MSSPRKIAVTKSAVQLPRSPLNSSTAARDQRKPGKSEDQEDRKRRIERAVDKVLAEIGF